MSKPLTKAETIGFRLDLDLDAQLRDEAERAGESPGQYAEQLVATHLRGTRNPMPIRDIIHRSSQDRHEAEQ